MEGVPDDDQKKNSTFHFDCIFNSLGQEEYIAQKNETNSCLEVCFLS